MTVSDAQLDDNVHSYPITGVPQKGLQHRLKFETHRNKISFAATNKIETNHEHSNEHSMVRSPGLPSLSSVRRHLLFSMLSHCFAIYIILQQDRKMLSFLNDFDGPLDYALEEEARPCYVKSLYIPTLSWQEILAADSMEAAADSMQAAKATWLWSCFGFGWPMICETEGHASCYCWSCWDPFRSRPLPSIDQKFTVKSVYWISYY